MGGVRRVDILIWVSVLQSPSALPRVTSPIHLAKGRQTSLRERGLGAHLPTAENKISWPFEMGQ